MTMTNSHTDHSDIADTGRAATMARYGTADDLTVGSRPTPSIATDEVLLAVDAAGVDAGVWHLMTGTPYLIRILGYGFRAPKQPVLGMDVAGRVLAVGADVTRFAVGDRVFGIANGSFADYAAAKETKLVAMPSNLTADEAAVSAVSGITALQAVVDIAKVQEGQRVLVIGASGGVGTFAVQIARALGAHVTGVGGSAGAPMMRSIGAERTIDYKTEDFVEDGVTYDAIIDIAGRNSLRRLRRALAPKGTLVIVGGEGGNKLTGGIGRQLAAAILSPFLRQRLAFFVSTEHYDYIERLATLLASGDVKPVVGRRFALEDAADAIHHLENGESSGKTVIVVADDKTEG